jgi:hypothetical protein
MWIPTKVEISVCRAQFYKLELDSKIRLRDCLLKIVLSIKDFHFLCWIFNKDIYGKLGWKYARRNDIYVSFKIDDNKSKAIDLEVKGLEVDS